MIHESFFYIIRKIIAALQTRGFVYVIIQLRNRLYRIVYSNLRVIRANKFKFEKIELNYCYAKYSASWATERTVEIPICTYLLDKENARNKSLLEIGNVLNNYTTKYDNVVVDKYELAEGVINEDIVSYKPLRKYSLAISISTLEHVGFDENLKDPARVIAGIQNIMKNCLARQGKLIFTIPIGYNKYIDDMIKNNAIKINKKYFFKRISLNNNWVETTEKEAFKKQYNFPYPAGNAILIGVITN